MASTIREIYEETGLRVSDLQMCGVKQFTHRKEGYRYIVFLYKTSSFSGELRSSDEGEVFWIERSELSQYQLSEGFEEMLDVFENDHLSENFHYFENGEWRVKNA